MKRTRHKPEQIIKKLREADAMIAAGKTIGQVVQSLEIKENTGSHCTPRQSKRDSALEEKAGRRGRRGLSRKRAIDA